jgi:hypothetical protein
MKQKLPCSKCGQLGHWHKDPTCPKSNDPFPVRDGKARGKGSGKKKRKKKRKKCRKKKPKGGSKTSKGQRRSQQPQIPVIDHLVYVVAVNGSDLPFAACADTACAKSVVGQQECDPMIKFCDEKQWPYKLVDDREPFRFGPGKRIWSKKALIIPVFWGGQIICCTRWLG